MIPRITVGAAFSALAVAVIPIPAAAKPPIGQYDCHVYMGNPPTATAVGAFFIHPENAYEVKDQPVSGKFKFDDQKQMVIWAGPPPLGFEVGILEQPNRYNPPRLRLYPKNADIGNVWKSAICNFQVVGKSSGATPSASDLSGRYTVGAKVFVSYHGELLPAVITGVQTTGYSVRYEANRYGLRTDSGITAARLRPRS